MTWSAGAGALRHPQGRARRHAGPDGHRRAGRRHRARHQDPRPADRHRQVLCGDDPARPDHVHRGRRRRSPADGLGMHRSPTRRSKTRSPRWRGDIDQIPSAVSAIKVDGKRAYRLAREGQAVELPARRVRIDRFDVRDIRRDAELVDVDVEVDCSSGTYIRALARDVGAALGVGGHLTALRRTRVGRFGLDAGPHARRARRGAAAELTHSTRRACWRFRAATSPPTRPSRRRHGRALTPAGHRRCVRGDGARRPSHRAAAKTQARAPKVVVVVGRDLVVRQRTLFTSGRFHRNRTVAADRVRTATPTQRTSSSNFLIDRSMSPLTARAAADADRSEQRSAAEVDPHAEGAALALTVTPSSPACTSCRRHRRR